MGNLKKKEEKKIKKKYVNYNTSLWIHMIICLRFCLMIGPFLDLRQFGMDLSMYPCRLAIRSLHRFPILIIFHFFFSLDY